MKFDAHGHLDLLRFNEYDRGDLPGAGDWYDRIFLPHWRALVECVNRPAHVERFRLQPGEGLIVSNHRVMHGRTAFSGGRREMIGCYIGRDDFDSRLRALGLLPMGG